MSLTLLFDLDDTLLDFKISEREALRNALQSLNIDVTDTILDRYSEINLSMWKKLERKEVTRANMKIERYQILFDEFNIQKDPKECCDLYEYYLSKTHFFIQDSEEVIKKLSNKYDLYIISNGTGHIQRGRIENTFIEKYFKGLFISEEIGFNKPDARFFDSVFHTLNLNKEECIVIGDSLTSDIKGAKEYGIQTIWYNPNNDISSLSDYEIHNLKELYAILKV